MQSALRDLASALDPVQILLRAGKVPDPWQSKLLRSFPKRLLLNCSRQSGKTTVVAAMALAIAVMICPALVLILSPSERQSKRMLRAIMLMHKAGRPGGTGRQKVKVFQEESALRLELPNGSEIVALPGKDETKVRGYSGVNLLAIDEAAYVSDSLYDAVSPMVAVSQGMVAMMSTPNGQRGFFHNEWSKGQLWERVMITADQCPRITAEFLAEEKQKKSSARFMQEYFGQFNEMEGAAFSQTDILRAISDDVEPLFFTPTAASDLVTVPMEPLFQ